MDANFKKNLNNSLLITDDGLFSYSVTNNKVTIDKYLGTDANVVVPETIENMSVTTIGPEAFMNNATLISISMPSIISILSNAFYNCNTLANISAPTLATLDTGVFILCRSLTEVNFPKLTVLHSNCFSLCISLTTANLPEITTLANGTFSDCYSLKTTNIPKLQLIDSYAFQNCNSLESIDMHNVIFINNLAFFNSAIKSIDLPMIASLGTKVFYRCLQLKNLILANVLVGMGEEVFSYCPIESLTIDYGTDCISDVTLGDWNIFADTLTGINVTSITGKYVKNNSCLINLVNPDKEAPVITLIGDNTVTVEVCTPYTELGAIVTDNSEEEIEAVITGTVDTTKVGQYIVTYTTTDLACNSSSTTRTVNVVDTIPPIITLNGESTITLIVGEPYIELGATVSDNSLESLTAHITGNVDTNIGGEYVLTYNATDNSGNKATAVTRTVKVLFNFSGLLAPFHVDNPNTFEANVPIPIKFYLTDIAGNRLSSATATLSYAEIVDSSTGPVIDAISIFSPNEGNEFMYDYFCNIYYFGLYTIPLGTKMYKLIIKLSDGSIYDNVQIELK